MLDYCAQRHGVKLQVAKRLIWLACAVISQDCLNKLEFKRKRKWVFRREEFKASDNILRGLAVQDPAGNMNVCE